MDAEIEAAVALDVARDIDGAVAAYEKLIADGKATADVYINVVMIYFLCNDPGFVSICKPSDEIIDRSWSRMTEVLELGRAACGDPAEMRFWLRYFRFIFLDEELSVEDALALAQEKEASLVPYFIVYVTTRDERWHPNAEALYREAVALPTVKNEYIRSMLENSLKP